jgi:hypothetical protein
MNKSIYVPNDLEGSLPKIRFSRFTSSLFRTSAYAQENFEQLIEESGLTIPQVEKITEKVIDEGGIRDFEAFCELCQSVIGETDNCMSVNIMLAMLALSLVGTQDMYSSEV